MLKRKLPWYRGEQPINDQTSLWWDVHLTILGMVNIDPQANDKVMVSNHRDQEYPDVIVADYGA